MSDPRRFDEGEATEFERQLFEAAQQQVPSAALKARMRQGLGIAAAPAPMPAPAAAKGFALTWKAGVFVGLVAVGASVTALLVARDHHQATPADTARSVSETAQPDLPASSTHGSVTDEIHLLDRARGALATGAPRRALDVLEQYDRRYPHGRFGPEAVALRVEALAAAGDTAAARALGQQFLAQHPTNPLAERVAKFVQR